MFELSQSKKSILETFEQELVKYLVEAGGRQVIPW